MERKKETSSTDSSLAHFELVSLVMGNRAASWKSSGFTRREVEFSRES